MNRNGLMEAGIDYEIGIKRFGNKDSIYEKFLLKFLDEPYFKQLMDELERGEIGEALRTAHALKGVTGTLSLDHFYGYICELVEALQEKNLERAKNMMPAVIEEYNNVIQVLRENH